MNTETHVIDRALAAKGPKRVYIMDVTLLKKLRKRCGTMPAHEVFENERRRREQEIATQKTKA